MNEYSGQCYCGAVRLRFETDKFASQLGARACQCDFCRLHGASWTSDPAGKLFVEINGPTNRFRMGTQSAEFLICSTCGVPTAVTWHPQDGSLLAVLRVECMEVRSDLAAHQVETRFEAETLDQRLARRNRNWMPALVSGRYASDL